MHCSSSLLALAALTIGQAAAGIISHRHFHAHRSPLEVSEYVPSACDTYLPGSKLTSSNRNVAEISKRSVLAATDAAFLTSIGFAGTGINSAVNNGAVWLGNDGPFTNDFQNNSTENVILTIWTGATSWVNANVPKITVSLPPGAMQTVSFANGVSGAWAGVYASTTLVMGQISQTWGEFTFAGEYTTIDVSREVNMAGRGMRIETPNCLSDMTHCVFVCTDGTNTCLDNYALQNCAIGSQVGANFGTYAGKDSGGCSGFGDTGNIKTFFY
jgi:hypothetical protein